MGAEAVAALSELIANFLIGGNVDSLLVREPDFSSWFLKGGAVDVVLNAVARNNDVADDQVL